VNVQLLLFAKAPEPRQVKTRLCPPATGRQAATIAAAALADTIEILDTTPAVRRTIVLSGQYPAPAGWHTVTQRGTGLAERLVHAYADTALPDTATLLLGMDTPQLTTAAGGPWDCPTRHTPQRCMAYRCPPPTPADTPSPR